MKASLQLDYGFQDSAVEQSKLTLKTSGLLCIVPCGGGKTAIAIKLIMDLRKKARQQQKPMPKILIIVPLSPLIRQFQDSVTKFGDIELCLKTGILAGSRSTKASKLADCELIIAMAQTIESRKALPWYPMVCIWDEAHLSCFRDAYPIVKAIASKSRDLALTATPWRSDGQVFDHSDWYWYQPVTTQQLIDQGYLVPYTTCALSKFQIKSKGADYTIAEAEQIASAASPKKVYEDWQPYKHLHTIGFVPSKMIAELYAAYFREQGQETIVINDETPESDRVLAFKRFREERIVLFSVTVLATGFDEPVATVALMLRPTKSISFWIQMFGRVLRTVKEDQSQYIESGCKDMAYILDFCGNTTNPEMPLPHEITDWKKVATPKGKKCQKCEFVNQKLAIVCAKCGENLSAPAKEPKTPSEVLKFDDSTMMQLLNEKMNAYIDNRKMMQVRMSDKSDPENFYRYWLQKSFLAGNSPGIAYFKCKELCQVTPMNSWGEHAVFGDDPNFEDFLLYGFYLKKQETKKERKTGWLWQQLLREFGTEYTAQWEQPLINIFEKIDKT
jgi:superfamily II DNA or RNA helicase